MKSLSLAIFCALILGAVPLRGQAPLVTDAVVTPKASEHIVWNWRIDAADRALKTGLVVLAEKGYRAALESSVLDDKRADELQVSLAAALIGQQRYLAAMNELKAVSEKGQDSRYYLYQALAIYGDGKGVERERFSDALKKVRPVNLNDLDQPWVYLARALRAELFENSGKVIPALEQAQSLAKSDGQKAFFKSLIFRQKMKETPTSESLAAEIRGQLERFSGEAAAYAYAREYAVMLYNMGRSEEAIGVIDAQRLNNQNLGAREREQLLLLKGMIAGQNTARGREAMQELVRSGQTREVMRVALQLLARGDDAANSGLPDFLNQMVARAEPHPLLSEIYYVRSQLALDGAQEALRDDNGRTPNLELARARTEAAERDAKHLLEQFPGFQQITSVYRLLAYAALQRKLPQYRAAADFLIQLRDQTPSVVEQAVLNRLIGDCYFLNRDYSNAVDFYRAAYARAINGSESGGLFLRLITAEVRSGQMEAAMQHIDEADFSGSVSITERWQAEWNVAQALKAKGQLNEALKRVRLLLEGSAVGGVPTTLDLRLRWLEADLSFLAGEDGDLSTRIADLLGRVESIPGDALQEGEAKLLVTEILLLQAQVMGRSGLVNEGMEVLKRLRVGYADSSAAQRSYLSEADYHALVGDFQAAQETLSKLAELYPESVLAPQAIFEAALFCERRGPEFFAEAVRIHNQIAENYATDELVFSARLKQGDLFRKLNEFVDAQRVYENLINSYPTHPLRYVPELSRVDCMLALAKNNQAQLDDVALSLERLLDIPNLPIDFQAEIGYKWGFALQKRESSDEAREVYSLIADRFLLDGEQAVQLGVTGRYWMSRAMLALGESLESSDDLAEARRVYRKMVAFNLPGRNLALARANGILVVEEPGDQ
ncbi:MAG: tetratricopeptide repeat protein [Opitutaceae bacterium]